MPGLRTDMMLYLAFDSKTTLGTSGTFTISHIFSVVNLQRSRVLYKRTFVEDWQRFINSAVAGFPETTGHPIPLTETRGRSIRRPEVLLKFTTAFHQFSINL